MPTDLIDDPRQSAPSVSTVGEFLEACGSVDDLRKRVWYRGHADHTWALQPKMLRPETFNGELPGDMAEIELSLCAQFVNRVRPFVPSPPEQWAERLALMRHYGLPTRLLDWSEVALTGLFFAVDNDERDSADGIVWAIEAEKLAGPVTAKWGAGDWEAELKKGDLGRILAWLPPQLDQRMWAQTSCFTVHPLRYPTDLQLDGSIRRYVHAIRIPAEAKAGLRRELAIAGITCDRLFPGLEGVARWMLRDFGNGFDQSRWNRNPTTR